MFTALLISSNELRRQALKELAVAAQLVALREYAHYPERLEEIEAHRLDVPGLVVLDGADPAPALRLAAQFRNSWPGTGILVLGGMPEVEEGLACAHIARFPPSTEDFQQGIRRAIWTAQLGHHNKVVAFLPSKAGSGASTVALQTAAALTSMGRNVVTVDCDWRSGCLHTMVAAEPAGTMRTALAAAGERDRFALERALTPVAGMGHLIFSGQTAPERMPDWSEYFHLFDELEKRFEVVIADLPEVVNPATAEVARRAQSIYVVTTPELTSLQLIDRRWRELTSYGVEGRAQVVVNRWQQQPIKWEQLCAYIEKPVVAAIPNDYPAIYRAMLKGVPVEAKSKLGRAYRSLAKGIGQSPRPLTVTQGWLPRLQELLGV